MNQGARPTKLDARDYDFIRSFGSVSPSEGLPDTLDVDAGLTMPNQNIENAQYTPTLPPLPYGCTDYTQTDLCIDEDGVLYNPLALEVLTHANSNGGADVRSSLQAARKAFNRTAFFNIRPAGFLDAFDAIRLAIYSALPEKRAVSIGIPWFADFEDKVTKNADGSYSYTLPNINPSGILPMPVDLNLTRATWHNAKVSGWVSLNGVLYLKVKSWQGPDWGDHGWCYMSRELINTLMGISGSCAYTLTKQSPPNIFPIDLNVAQRIVSFIRNLLGL